ncbi:MAG: flagellar motor protein MotA [Gammaproteobacteria bacterium]
MTRPIGTLLWMGLFTAIIAAGGVLLAEPLHDAFSANVVFNSIILGVLSIGVAINFRQVFQLYPEITWIERYQTNSTTAGAGHQPRLLSSMARLLSGKGDLVLSTGSMRTILDSIRTRIEDSRDLSRYMIGVLVFLGLLGTFWGLMATVSTIGNLISEMSVEASSGEAIFENLKNSLAGPLSGMGVAFSSSLFGLAGSLVVGFLDLQAGHAQNRFINELEEWLSSSTRISSGIIGDEGGALGAPAYVQALLEKTADALEKMQRASASEDNQREYMARQLGDMRGTFDRFNDLLGKQNDRFEQLNIAQNEITRLLKTTFDQIQESPANEELRSELRLLTKTIANALSSRGGS